MIDREKILRESVGHHLSNRLAEAEAGYKKILEADASDPEALFSLGYLYYQRNELGLAHDLMAQAIAVKNDVPMYHHDLGLVFSRQKKKSEAARCFREALRLDDNYVLAYYSLGNLYRDQGDIDQAIGSFEKACARDPLFTEALTNLLNVFSCLGADDEVLTLVNRHISRPHRPSEDRYHELVTSAYAMITCWKRHHIRECAAMANMNPGLKSAKTTKRNRNYLIYFTFISKLVEYYRLHADYFSQENGREPLHVFGDSQSLTYANLILGDLVGKSELIMGIKMWHLADPNPNFFNSCLKRRLQNLPKHSHLLFAIGDLDCRPEEGIWKVFKEGQRSLYEIIETTVSGYVAWLEDNAKGVRPASITVTGSPAPSYPWGDEEFTRMVGQVNRAMGEAVRAKGWRFLDVYSLTADDRGISNGKWHLDHFHVQPRLFYEAFTSHTQ